MKSNLKPVNNQKCQKLKLHGTPTTKELKKQVNQTTMAGDHAGGAAEKNLGEAEDHTGGAD